MSQQNEPVGTGFTMTELSGGNGACFKVLLVGEGRGVVVGEHGFAAPGTLEEIKAFFQSPDLPKLLAEIDQRLANGEKSEKLLTIDEANALLKNPEVVARIEEIKSLSLAKIAEHRTPSEPAFV